MLTNAFCKLDHVNVYLDRVIPDIAVSRCWDEQWGVRCQSSAQFDRHDATFLTRTRQGMKSVSIIQRIALGFGFIILLMIIAVITALTSGHQLANEVSVLARKVAPVLVQSRALTRDMFLQDQALQKMLNHRQVAEAKNGQQQLQRWQQQAGKDIKSLQQLVADRGEQWQQLVKQIAAKQQIYNQLSNDVARQYITNLRSEQSLSKMVNLSADMQAYVKKLQLLTEPLGSNYAVSQANKMTENLNVVVNTALQALNAQKPQEINKLMQQNKKLRATLLKQRKVVAEQLAKNETAFGGQVDYEATVGKLLDQILDDATGERGLVAFHRTLAQNSMKLRDQSEEAGQTITTLLDQLATLDKRLDNELDAGVTHTQSIVTQLSLTLIIGQLVAVLLAVLVLWRVIAAVKTPLNKALNALQQLRNGELSARVNYARNDEFGKLSQGIDALAEQMSTIIGDIVHTASQLSDVAQNNLTSLSLCHEQLEQQRNETASVATAMVEMEQTVADVAGAAHQSLEAVMDANKKADDSQAASDINIQRVNDLAQRLETSRDGAEKVHELSVNIGGIVDVISQVADQTNLLALNAAIEAARAGEQGRGFAVVADEVRNLASRTAESTNEIQQMIQGLQSGVAQAVEDIRSCGEAMSLCIEDSSHTQQFISEISAALRGIADRSSQISTAAEQQSSTSSEIARNLTQINSIADDNGEQINHVSATSEQLQSLSVQQQQLVNRFQLA